MVVEVLFQVCDWWISCMQRILSHSTGNNLLDDLWQIRYRLSLYSLSGYVCSLMTVKSILIFITPHLISHFISPFRPIMKLAMESAYNARILR